MSESSGNFESFIKLILKNKALSGVVISIIFSLGMGLGTVIAGFSLSYARDDITVRGWGLEFSVETRIRQLEEQLKEAFAEKGRLEERNKNLKNQKNTHAAQIEIQNLIDKISVMEEQNNVLRESFDIAIADVENERKISMNFERKLKATEKLLNNSVSLEMHNKIISENLSLIKKLSNDLYAAKNLENNCSEAIRTLFWSNDVINNKIAQQSYYSNALKFFIEQAKKGNVEAQYMVGYFFDPIHDKIKIKELKQDTDTAIIEYKKASGHSEAQYNIANLYYLRRHEYENAAKWYQYAADNGHTKAQEMLGYMYGLNRIKNKPIIPGNDNEFQKNFDKGYNASRAK